MIILTRITIHISYSHNQFYIDASFFKEQERIFIVRDSFSGQGMHWIENYFQINGEIEQYSTIEHHAIIKCLNQEYLYFSWDPKIDDIKIIQSPTSQSYGLKSIINRIIFRGQNSLPYERIFIFQTSEQQMLIPSLINTLKAEILSL